MKTSGKYAIFYCDQCELLGNVVNLMLQMYPGVEVKTASDTNALLTEVSQKPPQYILVYMSVHDESFISVVKTIREKVNTAEIPVVIYQALPGETELRKLSDRLN